MIKSLSKVIVNSEMVNIFHLSSHTSRTCHRYKSYTSCPELRKPADSDPNITPSYPRKSKGICEGRHQEEGDVVGKWD